MIDRLQSIVPIRKANSGYFHYRTNKWRFDRRFHDGAPVAIDRPVFLIGTQNGGLTLLARILHRHTHAISVTGDHRYWAGEDEAQDALADILPEDFGWRRIDLPGYPDRDHSWVYGNDDFLPFYRRKADELDPAQGARYRRVLQGILRQHGSDKRFIDKSQSLTLRVGAVHRALSEHRPFFVLISRDPYAVVWGQATRNGVLSKLDVPIEQKVVLAAQHWRNSMQAALDDAADQAEVQLRHWQFESILREPDRIVREICDFAELPWESKILPSANDNIPWGSRSDAFNKRKWYPLRPGVNDRYRAELPDWAAETIHELCGDIGERFGSEAPDVLRRAEDSSLQAGID